MVPPRPRNLSLDHKKAVMNSPNVVKARGNFEPVDFPSRDIDQSDRKKDFINIVFTRYLHFLFLFCSQITSVQYN